MKRKAFAIMASAMFATAALSAPAAAYTAEQEADIQACVAEATDILLNDPRYRWFRWVIRLGYWDATLRASCIRTLGY